MRIDAISIGDHVIARRWLVIPVIVIVTLFAVVSMSRINFDNSIESWFLDTDPSLAAYNRFTETFKGDQIVVVGVFADDIFDPAVLRLLDQVTSRASSLEFVERVQSITNTPMAKRLGGVGAEDFAAEVMASPLQRQTLLSPDARAAAIVIHYSRDGSSFKHKQEFVRGLSAILSEVMSGHTIDYAMTGGPVIGDAGQTRNSNDMRILVPAMILIIVVAAYGFFRHVSLTLLPLIVVGIAVVWTFGLMGVARWSMSMISIILIPLVLAVGVAHSIHIITQYRLELWRGAAHEAAIRNSLGRLLKPCFFTSITTIVGLLSLLVSNLGPVQEFALTAAAGVFAAFVLSVTLLPIMLLWVQPEEAHEASLAGGAVARLLQSLHSVGQAHTGKILFGCLLTAIAFLWLANRVESGLDPMSWIRHDDPIRIDTERIDNAFGGAISLEFLVTSEDGRLGEPALLRRLDEFERWLVENTTVGHATSLADLVKEAARIARDEGSSGYALPRTRVLTNGMLQSLDRAGELTSWVTPDFTLSRISARIPLTSGQKIVEEIPAIERRIENDFADLGITVEMTGQAVLAGRMQTHMIDSQLYSFAVALAVVSLIMILLLRSLPLGMLAMVPNLLPIVIGLGAMTLLDIALNPATVMIAAVALGIVVDDTVHLMTAFEREMRNTGSIPAAIRVSILDVGRPVFVTTVLLAAGFLTLVLGSFLPTRQIGGLIALIAVAALITDLLFLPAMLRRLPAAAVRKFLKNGGTSPRAD